MLKVRNLPGRILVTGASGLVGANLLKILKEEGDSEIYSLGRSAPSGDGAKHIHWDFLCDKLPDSMPAKCDSIVHLAQSEDFRLFPEKATGVFRVNTFSTMLLADYARRAGVQKIIYASSAGVYGEGNDSGFREDQEIVYRNNLGFYLATKYCSEILLDNYSEIFDVIILRLFFVYGKGQRRGMLLPRLVDRIRIGEPVTLAGEQGITIGLTHVSDAANAIKAALQLKGSHRINVMGPEQLSLREVCEIIGMHVHRSPQYEFLPTHEPRSYVGDSKKMIQLLWNPVVRFSVGVADILD